MNKVVACGLATLIWVVMSTYLLSQRLSVGLHAMAHAETLNLSRKSACPVCIQFPHKTTRILEGQKKCSEPATADLLDRAQVNRDAEAVEMLYTEEGHHHLFADRLDPAGLAPLTSWAQTEIYKSQHPQECHDVLVTVGWIAGFGSDLHVMGTHLARAIETGRPLVWGPQACAKLTNRTCGTSPCTCFFRELSNCTAQAESQLIGGIDDRYLVPTRFRDALKENVQGISDEQLLYWWRTQSVAYLARLNPETVQAVRQIRMNPDRHVFSRPPPRTFPLPPGTINAHIRGGDKHQEMRLVEPNAYARAATELVQNSPMSFRARSLYVSGDNIRSIQACTVEAATHGWTWAYSRIKRMDGGFLLTQYEDSGSDHFHSFTLEMLMQLLVSLEADGWVGTRGSNWNRLIDELRCVWVPKCIHPFVEVGDAAKDYFW